MTPPRSILDRAFRYTPAAQSDIRETFERAREALKAGATEYDSWGAHSVDTTKVRQLKKGTK